MTVLNSEGQSELYNVKFNFETSQSKVIDSLQNSSDMIYRPPIDDESLSTVTSYTATRISEQ